MAERALPGLGLTGYWDLGSNGWKPGMDENIRTLSALTNLRVLDAVATLPASPANGDIYLVTSGANTNKIAVRDNGTWVYLTPSTGWRLYDSTATKFKYFNGSSWVLELPDTSVSGLNLIAVGTASSSATLDFTGLTASYESYLLVLNGIRPTTNADINLRLKDSSSGSFYAGSTDYKFNRCLATDTSTTNAGSIGATAITLCPSVTALDSHGLSASVWINCPPDRRASVFWDGTNAEDGTGVLKRVFGAGYFRGSATTLLDGIRLLPSTGNLSEGTAKLYGLKNSL